jgi:hypothetical protein
MRRDPIRFWPKALRTHLKARALQHLSVNGPVFLLIPIASRMLYLSIERCRDARSSEAWLAICIRTGVGGGADAGKTRNYAHWVIGPPPRLIVVATAGVINV